MAQIEVIRHVAFEDLGILATYFAQCGDDVSYSEAMEADFNDSRYQTADLLVVLGAPIGVYDHERYPFLNAEIQCIDSRIQHHRPILGICLGAQLIAHVLGASVIPMPIKEIGYAPITLTPAGQQSALKHLADLPVLHWHGDRFDIPTGAVELAYTSAAAQAFMVEQYILALQFHLEVPASRIEHWLVGHACELAVAQIDIAAIRQQAHQHSHHLQQAAIQTITDWRAKQPA